MFIANALVCRQDFGQWPGGRKSVVNSIRQPLRTAKRVRNSLRQDRILVVASIADQRPTVPVGLAEEVGEGAGAPDLFDAFSLAERLGQIGDQVQTIGDIPAKVGADGMELVARTREVRYRQPIVGRKTDHRAPRARMYRRKVWRDIAPISGITARKRWPDIIFVRSDRLGD